MGMFARPSRQERFELEVFGCAEMLGIGRQQCQIMLNGGGGNQRIGQAHAVRQGQRVHRYCQVNPSGSVSALHAASRRVSKTRKFVADTVCREKANSRP